MSWLRIEIDLSMCPDGLPQESVVILRELADWIEDRKEAHAPTGKPKLLRNFEGEVCGKASIG